MKPEEREEPSKTPGKKLGFQGTKTQTRAVYETKSVTHKAETSPPWTMGM